MNFNAETTTLYAITFPETITKKEFQFGGGFTVNGKDVYIKEIIYNNPVTIVFWSDDTKTVSKCYGGDIYSPETGLSICVLKKIVGGKKVKFLMDDWLPNDKETRITLSDVRRKQKNK